MTPAARVQAAIELLDSIAAAAREAGPAADTIIAAYFRERRYAGSSDRRAVREGVQQLADGGPGLDKKASDGHGFVGSNATRDRE